MHMQSINVRRKPIKTGNFLAVAERVLEYTLFNSCCARRYGANNERRQQGKAGQCAGPQVMPMSWSIPCRRWAQRQWASSSSKSAQRGIMSHVPRSAQRPVKAPTLDRRHSAAHQGDVTETGEAAHTRPPAFARRSKKAPLNRPRFRVRLTYSASPGRK